MLNRVFLSLIIPNISILASIDTFMSEGNSKYYVQLTTLLHTY